MKLLIIVVVVVVGVEIYSARLAGSVIHTVCVSVCELSCLSIVQMPSPFLLASLTTPTQFDNCDDVLMTDKMSNCNFLHPSGVVFSCRLHDSLES